MVVALKTGKVDARDIPCILKKVAYLVRVHHLPAVRVSPIEAERRVALRGNDGVALCLKSCVVIPGGNAVFTRFGDAASVDPHHAAVVLAKLRLRLPEP